MLTKEDNARLTLTGPGTPGGSLLRCYWQPVALADEMPHKAAPMPVKILGEELVLFRDDRDRLGLIGLYCPHRCADLSYGRIEDGGLRCLYHGWLFDISGRCLQQPAEPSESRYKDEIRHTAYPVMERGGLIFAYLGKGEVPLLPSYEFLSAGADHRYVRKTLLECNYLQGIEGDIDPAHMSYLHRSWQRPPWARKVPRSVPGSDQLAGAYLRADAGPTLKVERTDFGVRNYAIRDAGDGQRYVRISNFIMPNKVANIGVEGRLGEGYTVHWRVPIDDESHVRFDFIFNRVRPLVKEPYAEEFATETIDNRYRRNKRNRYLQDREQMRTTNFTGMGYHHGAQDAFATETPGTIIDRSREHLGVSDTCIIAMRREMLAAIAGIEAGRDPIHVIRDKAQDDMSHIVVVSEVVPPDTDYMAIWKMRKQPRIAGKQISSPGSTRARTISQASLPQSSAKGARSKRRRNLKAPGSSRSTP